MLPAQPRALSPCGDGDGDGDGDRGRGLPLARPGRAPLPQDRQEVQQPHLSVLDLSVCPSLWWSSLLCSLPPLPQQEVSSEERGGLMRVLLLAKRCQAANGGQCNLANGNL